MSAIVLHHRTPDDTRLAVGSLLASRRAIDDIIVVNNDLDDGRQTIAGAGSRVRYLSTGRNLGFAGGMNAGIRAALESGAEGVLLVNSDVVVPPDCLGHLERGLAAVQGAGIAGAVVIARSDPSRVASLGMTYAPRTGRMRHRGFGDRVSSLAEPPVRVVDAVAGCLMLVTRQVFDAVGWLDEDYFFTFEELDFCLRARRAGLLSVVVADARVHHEGGRSIGAESPKRLYFAARNHLRLARRAAPDTGAVAALGRSASIVALNVAHAVRSRGGSLTERLAAVARGTSDYARGRTGEQDH